MQTETKKTFTNDEIENWCAFEDVRSSGAYNMYDPRARELTGLSEIDYCFTMHNYSALRKAAEAKGLAPSCH